MFQKTECKSRNIFDSTNLLSVFYFLFSIIGPVNQKYPQQNHGDKQAGNNRKTLAIKDTPNEGEYWYKICYRWGEYSIGELDQPVVGNYGECWCQEAKDGNIHETFPAALMVHQYFSEITKKTDKLL